MIASDKLNNFVIVLKEVINAVAIYKALESIYPEFKDKPIFTNLLNYSAMIATLRVSNFMGVNSEANHWKKQFDKSELEIIKNETFYKVFESKNDYEKYHKNLREFRNHFVTHYNLSEDSGTVIDFSKPKEVALQFMEYLAKNILLKKV